MIRWLAIASIAGQLAWVAIIFLGDYEDGRHGLIQRLALTAGGGWVFLLSLGLLVIHATGRDLSRAASA